MLDLKTLLVTADRAKTTLIPPCEGLSARHPGRAEGVMDFEISFDEEKRRMENVLETENIGFASRVLAKLANSARFENPACPS